ncbi:MAG: 16S rRNA (guanine(527)-N(7))-methyltransferase RsmG [Clostridia bacterium]|nr:16S rRNA (guanine(527)-N(7))-methyltransferase RsmG [Clostridia bacterium]MBO5416018.1 16S rRNA (guanine(527)-N(7))-methyltransferase RsmG [Clostridia bacterium]
MTEFSKELIRIADKNEATKDLITEKSAEVFEALCSRMLEVNEHLNLTAIRDTDGVILKHFVDSVAIIPYIKDGARVCDIGCGGGFPTLPIAILRPDVSIIGVDSVTKKVTYVNETAQKLGLNNVSVSNSRAEELGQNNDFRESFDVSCARALGKLSLLCELCLPLVKVGGKFIAMKSLTTAEEIKNAESAISLLGGRLDSVVEYTLKNDFEELTRTMVIIEKIAPTPKKYPRNNSQISKKPL